jgi:uncharacterized protein YneF (UPF0154 family)
MQTILLVFIVIFALAIGFFLGMFLLSLDTPFTKRLSKKEAPEEPGLPAAEIAVPERPAPVEKIQKPSPNSRLILQVWKEEGTPPVYDLGGTYLEKEDLPREILNIITIQADASPAPKLQPPPVTEKVLPIVEDTSEADSKTKIMSIVDEVNDILQKRLTGSPLAGKGIHLMENHNKEIRFWVGLNSYDDVDEIPDPEVRQIIDAAVKEWEKSRG